MNSDPATLHSALEALATIASREGVEAYLVGGAVRDVLLGRVVREADIAVAGDAESFVAQAARALASRPVVLGSRFTMWRLPVGQTYIDVTPMQGPIEEDLGRRDFTINALAVPLQQVSDAGIDTPAGIARESVIDLYGGLSDLDSRLLRLTRSSAFKDDPVRMLRCVRLASELAFDIEPETRALLRRDAGELGHSAAERIGTELSRLFESPAAARGLRLMEETGLLTACFPALEAGRDVEQRPVHSHTVLEHALVASEWLDMLVSERPPESEPASSIWRTLWDGRDWMHSQWGPVDTHLSHNVAALRAATLLHDVGKPQTRTAEDDGRTRFFGHAEVGAEIAAAELGRWRFPGAFIERVSLLVREHLRPGQVASAGRAPTARALYRFQRDLGDATPDVCWLFMADSLGTVGGEALVARWHAYAAHVHRLVTWTRPESAEQVRRLVDGRAVMAATGLPPGPLVGRLLAAIEEAAAAGDVTTVDEALRMARELAAQ